MEKPFIILGQFASLYYFGYLILLVPLTGWVENTLILSIYSNKLFNINEDMDLLEIIEPNNIELSGDILKASLMSLYHPGIISFKPEFLPILKEAEINGTATIFSILKSFSVYPVNCKSQDQTIKSVNIIFDYFFDSGIVISDLEDFTQIIGVV